MSQSRQHGQAGPGQVSSGKRRARLFAGAVLIAVLSAGAVSAAESNGGKDNDGDNLPLPPTTAVKLSPAEQYCSSVLDAATAAQLAQQKINLAKIQKQVDDRVALLAAKTEELKGWMTKREEFTAHATESLVQIYGKMKPDAAAAQLMAMDEFVAAAIMTKLSTKDASLIMAEMEAAKAARLSAVIAGAGEITMKPERRANEQQ
jgi:flagellar motility protein MotE (MotC chaperone)